MTRLCCLIVCLMSLLSACSTRPQVGASEPVSQMSAASEAGQRAKVHTELAALYYRDGNMAIALEELRRALEADGSYAPAYNVHGLVQMYLRENASAEASFRHALALAPNDPEINNNYGWFLCQTGRERESLSWFLAAIKNPLYPTPERAYLNAGNCALKVGDESLAEDYLQKGLRYGRPLPQASLPLAEIQYRRGNLVEARRLLADMHRNAEPTAASLWLAVRIEHRAGDRLAEASHAAQLRRRFPTSQENQALSKGSFE